MAIQKIHKQCRPTVNTTTTYCILQKLKKTMNNKRLPIKFVLILN